MPCTFTRLGIPELILVTPKVFADERGFFLESYKRSEFAANGIDATFVQDNHSRSSRGTLRGLHFQAPPHAQGKLVRAIEGCIWDVAVDIRRGSPTFGRWEATELSDRNHAMLWIPPGFAHGFIALSESVQMAYKCTAEYCQAADRGVRWDDPDLGIAWPMPPVQVSAKDAALPRFRDAELFP